MTVGADERFVVTLAPVSHLPEFGFFGTAPTQIAVGSAAAVILDDDAPFTIAGPDFVYEGQSGASPVTSPPPDDTVT